MNSKEFKKLFGEVAKSSGFESTSGGWCKESSECLIILELQKSNYGNYYQLNIKVYIQGVFGKTYQPCKKLIKSSMGHINSSETKEYKNVFDFDKPLDDDLRINHLKELFQSHIVPFSDKTSSKSGIRELVKKGKITLLPAVKDELT